MKMTSFKKLNLLLAILLASSAPLMAEQKIGLIDLKRAFDSYWKTKQADSNLKERAADLDKARKGMVDDFQKAKEEYDKLLNAANDQAVAVAERDKRKKAAEDKLLELRQLEQSIGQFDRQSRTTLAEQQRRLRDNILKEIRELVNAKAKAKGLSLVLDTAAESVNQTPVLLYSIGENDLTEDVIKDLNAGAPAIAPTVAPAPAAEKK